MGGEREGLQLPDHDLSLGQMLNHVTDGTHPGAYVILHPSHQKEQF